MRICYVSSYPPQLCGIAAYTASLSAGVRSAGEDDDEPFVLSEYGAFDGRDHGVVSLPTFRRSEDYSLSVAARASALGAQVVHVQHSADIFGTDDRLLRLLALLRGRGIRSVVTFHSVHSFWTGALERKFGIARFQRSVGELADAVVVHAVRGMEEELLAEGVRREKIHVIPHGTEPIDAPSQSEARRLLRLSGDGPLFLYFGFVHPQKGVHTVLLAMERLVRLEPRARLCIAGHVQNPSGVNRAYAAMLRSMAKSPRVAGRVIFRPGFASDVDTRALYRAADVVLLPYWQEYGSASGVAHQALGAGRLVLCSRSPKFAEIAESIDPDLIVPTYSARAWAEAMVCLLRDSSRRERLAEKAARFARETSWQNIGRRHLALYGTLVAGVESVHRYGSAGRARAEFHSE
jgi:glycosyltransferase involved in cell wall biosynthesis